MRGPLIVLIAVTIAAACVPREVRRAVDSATSSASVSGQPAATATPDGRGAARVEVYDGRWWNRAGEHARTMFVSGIIDCKSADAPGASAFVARSFKSYQDS